MDLEDLNEEIFDSFNALSKWIEYEHGLVAVGAGVGHGQRIQAQFCWGARVAKINSQLLPELGYVHWHI